jgi:vancomycin resistance protein YoaR
MKIDIPKRKLAFELYGTKDNRVIEISKARVWDKTPPPPDLYQDDPTLSLGTVKQIDWKAWGAKSSFDYKVTLDGQVLQEKTFYSNYRPWQSVFLRGTKQ